MSRSWRRRGRLRRRPHHENVLLFQQLPFQPEPEEEELLPDSPPRRTSTLSSTEVGVRAPGSGDGKRPFSRWILLPEPPRWVSQSTRRRRGSPVPASVRLAHHTFSYHVSGQLQCVDVRDPSAGVGPPPIDSSSSVEPTAPPRPVLPSPNAIVGHPGDPYLLTEAEMMDIDGLLDAPPSFWSRAPGHAWEVVIDHLAGTPSQRWLPLGGQPGWSDVNGRVLRH